MDNIPTSTQVRAAPSGALTPEYLRPAEASRVYSLSRSKLYELIKNGKIASVSLREEGQTKATRLLSVASLRRFLEARSEGGEE